MTKHRDKPTITAERIAWFASYYQANPAWGVFHVSLADGNEECGAALYTPELGGRALWPPVLREAAEWFDKLTQSQRRRLRRKAEGLARAEITPPASA